MTMKYDTFIWYTRAPSGDDLQALYRADKHTVNITSEQKLKKALGRPASKLENLEIVIGEVGILPKDIRNQAGIDVTPPEYIEDYFKAALEQQERGEESIKLSKEDTDQLNSWITGVWTSKA